MDEQVGLPDPYYADGSVTLYHADCRKIVRLLPSVDAVVTDPPYGLSARGAKHVGSRPGRGSRNLDFFPNDTRADGDAHADWIATDLAACVSESGWLYAWVGHRQFGRIVDALEAQGWETRFLVWRRACPVPSAPNATWMSGASLCVAAYRPGRVWNALPGDMANNVIEADAFRAGAPGKNGHPTQMREALVGRPIQYSTPPGGLVLDPFAGSGTTLRVAKDLGRRAIGIEIDERHCEIAANRLSQEVLDL